MVNKANMMTIDIKWNIVNLTIFQVIVYADLKILKQLKFKNF